MWSLTKQNWIRLLRGAVYGSDDGYVMLLLQQGNGQMSHSQPTSLEHQLTEERELT